MNIEHALNIPTLCYHGVYHGDWVKCNDCGKVMLLPFGADKCPECGTEGCLTWIDSEIDGSAGAYQEISRFKVNEVGTRKYLTKPQYLSAELLKDEIIPICPRCGKPLSKEEPQVTLQEYPWYCSDCDENFFDFEILTAQGDELVVSRNREIKRFYVEILGDSGNVYETGDILEPTELVDDFLAASGELDRAWFDKLTTVKAVQFICDSWGIAYKLIKSTILEEEIKPYNTNANGI